MGMDILDLCFRLERQFGIRLQRQDLDTLIKGNEPPDIIVQDLYDLVRSKVHRGGESVLDEESDGELIWPMFQHAVCDALGVEPDEVTKNKRLIRDLGAS